MIAWETYKSNEILDIRDGTHESPKYSDSGYPLITSKNLKKGKICFEDVNLISEEDYISINKRSKVERGDILFSMIGSIGNYAIIEEEPDYAIKNVALFKFNDDRLYNRYFLHLLNSSLIIRQIEREMKGGTQKFVSLKILRNLKIPLPPLETQKKIASILDAADAYRQKTKALIKKYDELTQSLFLEMFGDPVRNPKGWEKATLDECLLKVSKIDKSYSEESIEYVDIASVDNIRNVLTETTNYQTQERPSRAQQLLFSGDVLFSTVRPNLKNVAMNYVDGRIGSTGFFVCRTNSDILNNFFLYKLLLSDSVTDYFVGITSGANYPAIKNTDMRKFEVILPPFNIQIEFAERIQKIETQKAQAQQSLEKAEELFSSLLQRAFKEGILKS